MEVVVSYITPILLKECGIESRIFIHDNHPSFVEVNAGTCVLLLPLYIDHTFTVPVYSCYCFAL